MNKKYWLIYYGQRSPERSDFVCTNDVTDKHPAKFLLELIMDYPDTDAKLTFAIEIDAETYKDLKGKL
jgi:hypothetical protein